MDLHEAHHQFNLGGIGNLAQRQEPLLGVIIRGCGALLFDMTCFRMLSWREMADITLRSVGSAPSPPRAHTILASRTQPQECATPKALRAPRFGMIEASQPAAAPTSLTARRMMGREKQNSRSSLARSLKKIAGSCELDMATCRLAYYFMNQVVILCSGGNIGWCRVSFVGLWMRGRQAVRVSGFAL